ncbi:MAG: peptide chain release factor N(5)-glutamine methyltransferase [Candidatus Buchananbacteria bacterium]
MAQDINNLLSTANWALAKKHLPTPHLDAEVLLSWVIKKPKEFLYTYPQKRLSPPQIEKFNQIINRRIKGEPIAYIIGKKEFYGLDFRVNRDVLIPRPETELLVEETLAEMRKQKSENKNFNLVDVGTGSGAIIISLTKNLSTNKNFKYYASDISQKALTVAKFNANKFNVKIKFLKGNLLTPFKNIKIDILVANLPYVWPKWKNNKSLSAGLKFEPQMAIFTKEKGLYLYRQLFEQIASQKYQPSFIICEFDPRQTSEVQRIAKKILPLFRQKIKKDLAGLNRIIILSKIK